MSARTFHIAGIVTLGLALILSVAVSISLPTFAGLDFVRVNFPNAPANPEIWAQLRFGIWAPCSYDGNWKRTCLSEGHGYAVLISNLVSGQTVFIGSSWTRGLAIHPVATGFIAVAFGFACSKYEHGPLIAMFSSFLAAFLMLLAFIVDIALYAFVKQKVDTLHNANTATSAAFWMTFVSLILVLLSGGTIFFGRRKEVGADYPSFSSSKGGILSRFRKN